MNIVVIGHVDHGKSTVVGRLLADTGSLPEGKLEAVRQQCLRNSKPFEYAFLLDALKDEQAQGITIDSARCFFRSERREYIIIDAPGHIEFLKNMISGAARAEAGLLIIDAKERIQENSRRHGYLLSMLGIRQLAVCVNKMDLVDYDQDVFESIREEFSAFLANVGIQPAAFIPISAREGDNIIQRSPATPWYDGPAVLELMDSFTKEAPPSGKPLRLPVQDVYKFTALGDDRRIVAGRIETGSVKVGDDVVFLPSGKRSTVASIEGFNAPNAGAASAGESIGLTLTTQVYVKPGELVVKAGEPTATVSTKLRANVFWLSNQPMIPNKRYKMKLANARVPAWLTEVSTVLDASNLTSVANCTQIERHDVAQCVIQTLRPLACDTVMDIPQTGRFVIIDNYEIAGGGVILEAISETNSFVRDHVRRREQAWDRSPITGGMRSGRYNQKPALVLLSGPVDAPIQPLARELERYLFATGRVTYYLGISNALAGIDADINGFGERDEYLRRLGEMAHLFTDAGMILITTVSDLDDAELEVIQTLTEPSELVVVNVGESRLERRPADLNIEPNADTRAALRQIHDLLQSRSYLMEYYL